MENKLVINGIYKHFKGDYYLVIDTCIDSETGKTLVLYKSLYGECLLYVRSLEMFLEKVDKEKYPDSKSVYRFELQDIKSVVKR